MLNERWREVERLYDAACAQPVAQRAAFLAKTCQDPIVRREVESLLAQETYGNGLLDTPSPSRVLFQPGTRFGPYEILLAVGSGGMGDVYKALDTRLGRHVAIKVVAERFTERFAREARAIAALNHPHVCTLYDVGPKYLVMELLDGETLAAKLRLGPLPPALAARYGMEIADALASAHARGIIHRDLKPGNIMLTKTGVKVLDFGIASLTLMDGDENPAEQLTDEGRIPGTLAYMAPEQLAGEKCDARSDVYSCGLLLYEMLTGRRVPAAAVLAGTHHIEVASAPHLESVVRACLARDPEERWQSALDLKICLGTRCLAKDPRVRRRDRGDAPFDLRVASSAAVQAGQASAHTSRAAGWRRVIVAARAIIIAGLGGAVAWGVMRPSPVTTASAARLAIVLPPASPLVGLGRPGAFANKRLLAISPDGQMIAYVGPSENTRSTRLFLRTLDAFDPLPLTGTDGASAPFFSPDGQAIAFFSGGKLLRTSVNGGVATICDAPEDTGGSAGTWGPDGTIVFAVPTSAREGLRMVSALGGVPTVLTTPDPQEGGGHGDPSFIHGTRTVLYTTRVTKAGVPSAVMVYSLATKQQHRVIVVDSSGQDLRTMASPVLPVIEHPVYVPSGYVVFGRGAAILAAPFRIETLQVTGPAAALIEQATMFDMSSSGRLTFAAAPPYGGQLVWVDRRTGATSPISAPDQRFGRPRLSPDGRRIAVEVLRGVRSDIGVFDTSSRILTLLTHDGTSNTPTWNPDGQHIDFRAQGRGLLQLQADGRTGAGILLATSHPALPPTNSLAPGAYTPDGSRYLFVLHGSAETGADIFAMELGGARQITPLVQRPGNQWAVGVSPDGRWMSYASDESGQFEVYVENLKGGGGRHQMSVGGGSQPMWLSTGRELFYRNGDEMIAAAISTNPDSPIDGTPKVLFTGHYQTTDASHYDVTADGQRLLMVKPVADDGDSRTIRVVDGWSVELSRRGAASSILH